MKKLSFAVVTPAWIFVISLALGLTQFAHAGDLNLVDDFTPTPNDPFGTPRTSYAGSLGYYFTYTGPTANVTSLGVMDANSGALADDHVVTLYTTGGTPLTTGTVAAGTGISGFFDYTSVLSNSVALTTGTQYVLAANYPSAGGLNTTDPFFDSTSISSAIATFQGGAYSSTGSSGFPDTFQPGPYQGLPLAGYVGPSLTVSATVPEPSSVVMLGLGAATCLLLARVRRSSQMGQVGQV